MSAPRHPGFHPGRRAAHGTTQHIYVMLAAMAGYLYFMSNRKDGPLYTGVTADIGKRVYEHKEGVGSAFCRRYGLTRCVYFETFDRIDDAIAREKTVKKWRRQWKVDLIETVNPDWADLNLTQLAPKL
ncbi:MAG: GIY-YIG nuclease family protein [Parvularculaceae bacterium]